MVQPGKLTSWGNGLSHSLQGFIYARWLVSQISWINSSKGWWKGLENYKTAQIHRRLKKTSSVFRVQGLQWKPFHTPKLPEVLGGVTFSKKKTSFSCTLPETNSLPLKIGRAPKGNYILFQPSIFRCELLVSGRVPILEGFLETIQFLMRKLEARTQINHLSNQKYLQSSTLFLASRASDQQHFLFVPKVQLGETHHLISVNVT